MESVDLGERQRKEERGKIFQQGRGMILLPRRRGSESLN